MYAFSRHSINTQRQVINSKSTGLFYIDKEMYFHHLEKVSENSQYKCDASELFITAKEYFGPVVSYSRTPEVSLG